MVKIARLAALTAALFVSSQAFAVTEIEFNNTFGTAQNLGAVLNGSSVTVDGSSPTLGDRDFYSFTLGAGSQTTLSLSALPFANLTANQASRYSSPILTVFYDQPGPGRTTLGAGTTGFSFTSLAAGTYFARVTDGRFSNYSLTIAAVPEPETYALMLAGLGVVGMVARRKKQFNSPQAISL